MKLPICHIGCNLWPVKWWPFFEASWGSLWKVREVSNEASASALWCIPHAPNIENRCCQCWKFHSKRTPPPLCKEWCTAESRNLILLMRSFDCRGAVKPKCIEYISESRKNAKINQLSRMLKIPLFIRPPLIPEGEWCGKKRLKLISLIALVPFSPLLLLL